jgi:hypothetical protein
MSRRNIINLNNRVANDARNEARAASIDEAAAIAAIEATKKEKPE